MRHPHRFTHEEWQQRAASFTPEDWQKHAARHQRGRIGFGILVALGGLCWLLYAFHVIPRHVFNSEYTPGIVCLVIGIMIGIKSGFRRNGWWVMMAIGIANLIHAWDIAPGVSTAEVFPALMIIAGGIVIVLRSRRMRHRPDFGAIGKFSNTTNEGGTLNIDILFAGKKEIVTSKEFRGGTIQATFGGVELNLMQADGDVQPMILDCKITFGGLEIIIPSHWQVINEVHPTFGSAEDERSIRTPGDAEAPKTLIIRGTCTFGSIEIKSY